MQQGVSDTEACRIVGINRRTVKRWRYGRGASGSDKAAPPMTAVEPPSVPSRYLSVQPELVAEIPGVLGYVVSMCLWHVARLQALYLRAFMNREDDLRRLGR